MKRIRITSNNTVDCPKTNDRVIKLSECKVCEDCICADSLSRIVLCKRGNNKDIFLKKSWGGKCGKALRGNID